jgi:AcrR family transcriptional regulator
MGYTTGVLRHYFEDKDALLLFAKNLLWDHSFKMARLAAERTEGLDKLRAMTLELMPSGGDAIDRYRLLAMFNGNAIGDTNLMRIQNKRNERHAELFARVIASLQKQHILPRQLDPILEASGILALNDGLAEQVIMSPGSRSPSQLTALVNRHIDFLAYRPRAAAIRRTRLKRT